MAIKHPKELRGTAYHEAGHAVACLATHASFNHATIVPEGNMLGHIAHPKNCSGKFNPDVEYSRRNQNTAERRALISLAGPAAERRFAPRAYRWRFGKTDFRSAFDFLSSVSGTLEETQAYFHLMEVRAKGLVRHPMWMPTIKAVAAELLKKKTLSSTEIRVIHNRTIHQR